MRPFSGGGRAQENEAVLHVLLPGGKEDGHARNYQNAEAGVDEDERAVIEDLAGAQTRTLLTRSADLSFAKEAVVVPLQQMSFHLAHGVEHHAHNDQHAGASEELRRHVGDLQCLRQ